MSLPAYTWLSLESIVPERWDLRRLGWDLAPACAGHRQGLLACPALLDWRRGKRLENWRAIRAAPLIVAVGVDEAETRAALLGVGFGDAVPSEVPMVELAARLIRLDASAPKVSPQRQAGPVTLDLIRRDGHHRGRWVGLHPREFALLWRLAETPFQRVSKPELLEDVCRLDTAPDASVIERHVSRLRAKLAVTGVGWLVRTCPDGGYQLGQEGGGSFAAFSSARREKLDTVRMIGNAGLAIELPGRDGHGSQPAGHHRTVG